MRRTARPDSCPEARRILVPVSASPGCVQAVREIARRSMNDTLVQVHLLHVRRRMNWYAARFISAQVRRDWHRGEAQEVLAPCRRILDSAGVAYSVHVEMGDEAACIAGAASRLHCDRVVVGTARAGSLTGLVDRLAVAHLRRNTPVPVEAIAGEEVAPWERYGVPAAVGALLALWLASAA